MRGILKRRQFVDEIIVGIAIIFYGNTKLTIFEMNANSGFEGMINFEMKWLLGLDAKKIIKTAKEGSAEILHVNPVTKSLCL